MLFLNSGFAPPGYREQSTRFTPFTSLVSRMQRNPTGGLLMEPKTLPEDQGLWSSKEPWASRNAEVPDSLFSKTPYLSSKSKTSEIGREQIEGLYGSPDWLFRQYEKDLRNIPEDTLSEEEKAEALDYFKFGFSIIPDSLQRAALQQYMENEGLENPRDFFRRLINTYYPAEKELLREAGNPLGILEE